MMDNKRFHYEASRKRKAAVDEVHAHGSDAMRRLLVGATSTDVSQESFVDALSQPWFLNQKVAAAGENTYFLSYGSVSDAQTIENALSRKLDIEQLKAKSNGIDADGRDQLFHATLQTMQSRQPHKLLLETIPKSEGGLTDSLVKARSATSERLLNVKSASDFERDAFREFFQRQALVPVRVTAMPSLAYARFWALSGCARESRGEPLEFRFKDKLLRPVGTRVDRFARMSKVFDFLNTTTQCKDAADYALHGEFGPEMGVFANLHGADRFLRLRFAREALEKYTYLSIVITLHVKENKTVESCSIGLLHAVSKFLMSESFRIERCSNQAVETDEHSEKCEWNIVAKATNEHGASTCGTLLGLQKSQLDAFQKTWGKAIHALAPNPEWWHEPEVAVAPGFVPRDR